MQKYLMKKRIMLFFNVVVLGFIFLIARLGYITFYLSNRIDILAHDLWTREIEVHSSRGRILDRNGELIVGNKLAVSVASINRQITDKEQTARVLSQILDAQYNEIFNHLNKNVSVQLIKPQGRRITLEQAKEIVSANLAGIYLVTDSTRFYPYGNSLAATVGFTGVDGDGLAGLEAQYNEYLEPIPGTLNIYTDAKGNLMPDMVSYFDSTTPGMDIQLTIDMRIQTVLDRVITNAASRYNPDQILGLTMNVKTGELLAMSSYPSFDPADYQNYPQEIYNRNLPIWMNFEPGSTFKIMTYAAGLEEGVFSLEEGFYDQGYKIVGGHTIKDWKAGGHGHQTFLEVIENSCNPGFMEIGERLGQDTFYKYLKNFGFGEKTGIDLVGESSGIVFSKDKMGPVELATSSFGQGNSVTAIQLATAASAAINGGNLMKPYILNNIIMPGTNELVFQNEPYIRRNVISDETSDKVRYALESVVARGTGRGAHVNDIRMGGKTGTGQKVGEDGEYMSNNYILSFIGAAPMDNPEIITFLAIDNPKNTIQYGGVVAAPLVGEIQAELMQILNLPVDTHNQIPKNFRYYIDRMYYITPDVVGMSKNQLRPNGNYNYIFMGTGSKVIAQMPAAGQKIPEGSSIMVWLN